MQCINACTQWCCSCSHAEPASFCEHTAREASGPTILHRCERLTQPNWCSPCAFNMWYLYLPSLQQSPSPATAPSTAPRGSRTTQTSCSLHFQAHDGETRFSSEKEDDRTTGKVEKQASQPSLPSAAYRIRNLPNIYRKQVISTWK